MKVTKRTIVGKKTKQLKRRGLIPAVIYGKDINLSIEMSLTEFEKLYNENGHTSITKLEIGTDNFSVLIDHIQINPVSRLPIHATFRHINLKEEINATVPIEYLNQDICKGVKEDGGVIVANINEVEVISLPAKLPHHIDVDMTNIGLGDVIKLEDIKLPEGVRYSSQDENVLSQVAVTVTHKAAEEVAVEPTEFIPAESTKEKKPEDIVGAAGSTSTTGNSKKD